MLKRFTFLLMCFVFAMFVTKNSTASNIQITNVSNTYTINAPNDSSNFATVSFDITWQNSWNLADGRYDAAWIFVRYRRGGTSNYQIARLYDSGNSHGSNSNALIQVGLVDESSIYEVSSNPGVGAFLYRNTNGTGTFSSTGVSIKWNYMVDGIADNELLDVQVYGIEMAFIPSGQFDLGSGGSESGSFTAYYANGASVPYTITDEFVNYPIGTTGATDIWGTSTSGNNTIGGQGDIPAAFPKGYAGFFAMKYEISQQQYCDFLNALKNSQSISRAFCGKQNRNQIDSTTTSVWDPIAKKFVSTTTYSTTNQYVACNYISWLDAAAFADWSGMRPMTELEFEKMARGGLTLYRNDFPWGTPTINLVTSITNAGLINEGAANGNALYANSAGLNGPGRTGLFQSLAATRYTSGCSFYGIADLAGNLYERAVTVGNQAGRDFIPRHGDGKLANSGNANVDYWPGNNGTSGVGGEITTATGIGFRGGSWASPSSELNISDRSKAVLSDATRSSEYGFRAVRSMPTTTAE